eukprot:2011021-Rhodomonas_salina.2
MVIPQTYFKIPFQVLFILGLLGFSPSSVSCESSLTFFLPFIDPNTRAGVKQVLDSRERVEAYLLFCSMRPITSLFLFWVIACGLAVAARPLNVDSGHAGWHLRSTQSVASAWDNLSPSGTTPAVRESAGQMAIDVSNAMMYVFGGMYYDGTAYVYLNDFFSYNINTNAWVTISSTGTPSPRAKFSLTHWHGALYLFGGELDGGSDVNDLYKYTISTNAWSLLSTSNPPTTRTYHSAAVHNGVLYIFSGVESANGINTARDDMWAYIIADNAWLQLSGGYAPGANVVSAYRFFSSAVVNGRVKFYSYGGYG